MKVLFVCHGNTTRSQMAKAFYNSYTKSNDADSAGVRENLEQDGATVGELAKNLKLTDDNPISAMLERGIDISNFPRTQLTPEMLGDYDLIVDMTAPQQTPTWLNGSNVIRWENIPDPKGKEAKVRQQVRDNIEQRVKKLIEAKYTEDDPRESDDGVDKEQING